MASAAGLGARSIRLAAGVTLTEVAKVARFYGLPWTSGKVGDFESGRVSASLPNLFAVAATLGDVCNRPVALSDLFPGDDMIVVNSEVSVEASRLREVLNGSAVHWEARDALAETLTRVDEFLELPASVRPVDVDKLRAVTRDFSESDQRFSSSIGIGHPLATAAMAKLWGRTFVAERDARAGPDANAQKKGRVARELKAEMMAVLNGDD